MKGAAAMRTIAHNTHAISRHRTPAVTPTRTSGSAAVTDARADAEVPEGMTERWKHRVEAEARRNLERNIRGLAAR